MALRPLMMIHVANDAETGISASELDTGLDVLSVRRRVGGDFELFHVKLVGQDEGMLLLEVR